MKLFLNLLKIKKVHHSELSKVIGALGYKSTAGRENIGVDEPDNLVRAHVYFLLIYMYM